MANPPKFGNLLTLPIEDGLMYIQPVYATRAGSTGGYPILRYVLVSYGGQVGIGTTLTSALGDALLAGPVSGNDGNGDQSGTGDGTGDGNGNGGNTTGTISERIQDLLARARPRSSPPTTRSRRATRSSGPG